MTPPSNCITIRPAAPTDARLLAQLGARLFEQAFGEANDPDNLRRYLESAFSVDKQSAELSAADRAVFIADDAERAAIGYAMVERGARTDAVVAERPAEINRLYADREWHGRGVGDALMRACVEHASRTWRCDVLWLGVWEENPRAIAFYQRSGFAIVGKQTFAVGGDVQHDHVMARALTSLT